MKKIHELFGRFQREVFGEFCQRVVSDNRDDCESTHDLYDILPVHVNGMSLIHCLTPPIQIDIDWVKGTARGRS